MTAYELSDYLQHFIDEGKGDVPVLVANKEWNPVTDGDRIDNAIFMEWKDGDCIVVLQYG